MITSTEFILYVHDQEKSMHFYSVLLDRKPILHVPGMTEFHLGNECKLGLMPNKGIAKILNGKTNDPATGTGIPRCEIYLMVDEIMNYYNKAIKAGANLISEPEPRDWGHTVCYFSDPDGHVVAFAKITE